MGAHGEVPSLRFVVTLVGHISVREDDTGDLVTEGAADAIEAHLDQVMDELDNLGAGDPSIELCDNDVEFTVMVDATNPLGAVSLASGLLRTAIHAAKGGTPEWPRADDESAWSVELVSVRSDKVPEEQPTTDAETLVPA